MYWLVYVKADGQTDGHGYINYAVATDREYKSLNMHNQYSISEGRNSFISLSISAKKVFIFSWI